MKTKTLKQIPLPKLVEKAQTVFNKWVRNRDKDKGCISCGAVGSEAGHYFSRGHYSALRFSPENTHLQCTRCNRFLHGNLINYRIGLVKRYGENKVLQLEAFADMRKAKKWDRTELEAIIQEYKIK